MADHDLQRLLRGLAEPLRLRLLDLLTNAECSVGELAQILNARQSLVSTQLAVLREIGLVQARRAGRRSLCRAVKATLPAAVQAILADHAARTPARADRAALNAVLKRRSAEPAPEELGADHLPGRTWEAFARALLPLLPAAEFADLGCGSGAMSLLLAQRARKVIAVDRDPAALGRVRSAAARSGLSRVVECREGDVAHPTLRAGEVDVVILSQILHELEDPASALRQAVRGVRRGGQVVVLELLAHQENWVLRRLGHRHTGFSERALQRMLKSAGLSAVRVERASRDARAPHFVALLATGRKGSAA